MTLKLSPNVVTRLRVGEVAIADRKRNFAAAEPVCIFPTVLHGTEYIRMALHDREVQ